MGGIIIGIILILIGLSSITGISFVNFIVAIVLIVIGIRMIMRRGWSCGPHDWHGMHHARRSVTGDDYVDEVAVFSSVEKTFTSQQFKGGKVSMVFSGGTIDLSGVRAEGNEVHLDVSSVFSGLNIIIPKDWTVRSEASPVAGNVETYAASGEGSVTFTLHGQAVFGEIKVRK